MQNVGVATRCTGAGEHPWGASILARHRGRGTGDTLAPATLRSVSLLQFCTTGQETVLELYSKMDLTMEQAGLRGSKLTRALGVPSPSKPGLRGQRLPGHLPFSKHLLRPH